MYTLQQIARSISESVGRDSWLIDRLRPAYESFLECASLGRGILWPINGAPCYISPSSRRLINQDHEKAVATFLRENVRPGQLCLDVGANVGQYVLQFGHWTAPHGRIIAFEPCPETVRVLERHVKMNGLENRVRIVNAAVGEIPGFATLYFNGSNSMNRLGTPDLRILGKVDRTRVQVLSLDDFCETQRLVPDWILIDIEGFEIAALHGAERTLNRLRGRVGLVVEMHPKSWESAGATREGAQDLMKRLGLIPIPLTGQHDLWCDYGLVHLRWDF